LKLLYTHDFNILVSGSSQMWFTVGLPESYFDRFFSAGFSEVSVISRKTLLDDDGLPIRGWKQGKNHQLKSSVSCLSSYFSFFKPQVIIATINEIRRADFIVVNFPTINGCIVLFLTLLLGKKYSVEVAGDETMWNTKRGGKIIGFGMRYLMPLFIKKAVGAAYVTNFLKEKYPNTKQTIVASNVNLENFYERSPLLMPLTSKAEIKIGFVGGLTERKGIYTLLKALLICHDQGFGNIKLQLIGGHEDANWREIVVSMGLKESVEFCGLCTKEEVFSFNKRFDIYVQPSHSEGLPRASIEAMACGTPVVASNLPGFRELLHKNDCCAVGDEVQLSKRIIALASDHDLYNRTSKANFSNSKKYDYVRLSQVRSNFYAYLRKNYC
jgi:glycosyltransferase involved in cell wall biosynthesis